MAIAGVSSPVMKTTFSVNNAPNLGVVGWGGSSIGAWGTNPDPMATAGKIAANYQSMGDAALAQALGLASGAQGYVDQAMAAARGAQNQIGQSVSQMNQFAGQAATAAGNISGSIDSVNQSANQVGQIAGQLTPFAERLNQLGLGMMDTGQGIVNTGNDWLSAATSIVNGDQNAGGMVGDLIRAIASINPETYVSLASADVQQSYQNVFDQMKRDLARSGVDIGSGKFADILSRQNNQLASSLAGAQTRASIQGGQDRLAALTSGLGVANSMAGTAGNLLSTGVNAQAAGGNMVGNAASVIGQQGQLYAQQGQLAANAGQLSASQANAYTAAGQLTQGAANLTLQGAQAQLQAAGLGVQSATSLANVGLNAAQLYYGNAQGFGGASGLDNIINGLR